MDTRPIDDFTESFSLNTMYEKAIVTNMLNLKLGFLHFLFIWNLINLYFDRLKNNEDLSLKSLRQTLIILLLC